MVAPKHIHFDYVGIAAIVYNLNGMNETKSAESDSFMMDPEVSRIFLREIYKLLFWPTFNLSTLINYAKPTQLTFKTVQKFAIALESEVDWT